MPKICNTPFSNLLPPVITDFAKGFELSDFQKYAMTAIMQGHHVLVTAHTGSGKTLPAEFAISYFTKRILEKGEVNSRNRIIYCSPIKALSNQKYYDFAKKFPELSVGLLTGDIKANPCAQVLIMTTEILMNQLFQRTQNAVSTNLGFQMDIENELACVIFDEVHYINDNDRGHVWEKSILMLPKHVQMIMLSATIDRPEQFAQWVESTGEKEVWLCPNEKRVVPLTHYVYMCANESVFKAYSKDKTTQEFIRQNTGKPVVLKTQEGQIQTGVIETVRKITDIYRKQNIFVKRKHVLNKLCEHMRDQELLPAIVFVYSRKQVEQCAKDITTNVLEFDSKVPYTVANECEQIVRKSLPNYREYLELPEYVQLVSLLEKGIGIHHSGMVPILREIVEFMISKKVIKVLFATESFAIGLDCPIRTAVFTSLVKFDNNGKRYVYSHEYMQAAGRAGRRGQDTVGHVIHCNNLFDLPANEEYKQIVCGAPQKLVSKFHISYPAILSLLKTGPKTKEELRDFLSRTMLYRDLSVSAEMRAKQSNSLLETIATAKQYMENMRTPIDICKRWIELEQMSTIVSFKRRKEIEKEQNELVDNYRWLKQDVETVRRYEQNVRLQIAEKECEEHLKYYVIQQINQCIGILLERGFIQVSNDDSTKYFLNDGIGKMGASIAEIHPIVASELCIKWNMFEKFEPNQIAGYFAMFCDCKVADEYKRDVPFSNDAFLKEKMQETSEWMHKMHVLEKTEGLETGIVYDNILQYVLPDLIMKWYLLDSESECKQFVQNDLAEYDIGLGDFIKAVLKIVATAREFSSIVEESHNHFLHKLASLEKSLLKYIVITQSLYV